MRFLGIPMVWLGLCASTAEGRVQSLLGLIPGQGTKIKHALAKTKQNKTHKSGLPSVIPTESM